MDSRLRAGDSDGALRASRNSKLWSWISFAAGIVFNVAVLLWFSVSGDKLLNKLLSQMH